MKNIQKVISLFLVSILFINCSSDKKEDTNPTNTFSSNININFVNFNPSISSSSLYTLLETGINGGQANKRTFYLRKNAASTNDFNATMELKITYPIGQTIIDGTYEISNSNLPVNAIATGQYQNDSSQYIFSSGSIYVTDLGLNKFRVEFINAKIAPFGSAVETPVTGFCQGTFY
ncbi:hypothetical protein [Flavobacterium sp.]|uniref:hypothetical protein n=1 Tax=Flavobacterium sp. TaxID=239 RepID=UPI003750E355